MQSQRFIEVLTGLFVLLALFALTVLALKVSGLTNLFPPQSYTLTAAFDEIGGLKIRAPVKMSGVQIGEITQIKLDPVSYKGIVSMRIEDQFKIPNDSLAGIYTAGLLGDNYIAITPMYSQTFFKNGDEIELTHSAMILEKLIGQLIYKLGNNSGSSQTGGDHAKTNE